MKRKAKPETAPRVPYVECAACGKQRDRNLPAPYEWDVHVLSGELVCSCSPECRRKLGYVERKLVTSR